METRAQFALIGAFAVTVMFSAFAFVFWMTGARQYTQFETYELVVPGSVAGLTTGSAVEFNGLKVGEVQHLAISREDPGSVDVLISIDKNTPVKENTKARLETTTLSGVGKVQLVGGAAGAPDLKAREGERYPRIAAERSEIQNLLETVQSVTSQATIVFGKLDRLLDANADSITSTLKSVETISKTIADDKAQIDSFFKDAAEAAHSLKPMVGRMDRFLAAGEQTVKAIDPRKLKHITSDIAGATANINRFSATGLRQYEQLAVDARKALDTLDHAVRSFERDPSQVIFGPSQAAPATGQPPAR
jgi:phospholipid/cholesterol/gamma-HCH transport system substrate-binding protein